MDLDKAKTPNIYGYSKFKVLFWSTGASMEVQADMPNFRSIVRIFPKVHRIIVFDEKADGFRPSISIDNWLFCPEMSNIMLRINEDGSLRNTFQEFIFIKPKESVLKFVHEKRDFFQASGWRVSAGTYDYKKRGVSCNETLFIRPRWIKPGNEVDQELNWFGQK